MRISVAAGVACIASLVAIPGSVTAEEHAVPPEQPSQQVSASAPEPPPPGREVCTTVSWGFDDVVRTDCSYGLPPQSHGNPALKGICMTLYGNRTCY
jgi:hypothetical protein